MFQLAHVFNCDDRLEPLALVIIFATNNAQPAFGSCHDAPNNRIFRIAIQSGWRDWVTKQSTTLFNGLRQQKLGQPPRKRRLANPFGASDQPPVMKAFRIKRIQKFLFCIGLPPQPNRFTRMGCTIDLVRNGNIIHHGNNGVIAAITSHCTASMSCIPLITQKRVSNSRDSAKNPSRICC